MFFFFFLLTGKWGFWAAEIFISN